MSEVQPSGRELLPTRTPALQPFPRCPGLGSQGQICGPWAIVAGQGVALRPPTPARLGAVGAASSRASRGGSASGRRWTGRRRLGGGGSAPRLRAAPPSPPPALERTPAPPSDLPPGAPQDEPQNSKGSKTLIFVFNTGLAQYKDKG